MAVQLLDLKEQYRQISNEIKAVLEEVLGSGEYILGRNVAALENAVAELCGARYGIGVASGTDALILSLVASGIKPGDEVITTPFTFIATAESIVKAGGRPVFVDIDPLTYNIDANLVERKITLRTKAILPVHIFGQMADLDHILALAEKYNLIVIEDACQAIGAAYKGNRAGSLGSAGCFSFYPTKNLGCYGDGGMVVSNDQGLTERIRLIRVHGSEKKYYHSIPGYNSRLDEVQAAILMVKIKYLSIWNDRRRFLAALYDRILQGSNIAIPHVEKWNKSVYHLYVIRTRQRDSIRRFLAEEGIGCGVYYPLPLHLQEVYSWLGYRTGDLPEAERAAKETLALPLYPEMSDDTVCRVAETLLKKATL